MYERMASPLAFLGSMVTVTPGDRAMVLFDRRLVPPIVISESWVGSPLVRGGVTRAQ